MEADQGFDVFVSDYSSSVEEYRRAMAAPKSDLPKLTAQQKTVAKKMGISEEDYQRGVLAGRFGEKRMLQRGKGLGTVVKDLLGSIGSEYRVEAVKAEMFNGRWLIRVAGPDRVFNVAVPRELADDVLDSGAAEEVERLKRCLLAALGHTELAPRR